MQNRKEIDNFRNLEETTKNVGKARRFRIPAVIAAAVALLVLLPNTGAEIAQAMGNIPVIGKLFQAVTFRDYQYESERFGANVEVPQIVVEDMGETLEGTEEDSNQLQETIEQVNFDIAEVTNQLIEEF